MPFTSGRVEPPIHFQELIEVSRIVIALGEAVRP
jgi:hypothetical protein